MLGCFGYESLGSFDVNFASIIIFALLVIIYFLVKFIFKKKMSVLSIIFTSAVLGIIVCFLLP